jgi:hypothetical protein
MPPPSERLPQPPSDDMLMSFAPEASGDAELTTGSVGAQYVVDEPPPGYEPHEH